jgi:hypothetical protein
MTTMHLIANAETIDRLVEQGVDFSKAFHAEFEKDPTGPETQRRILRLAPYSAYRIPRWG